MKKRPGLGILVCFVIASFFASAALVGCKGKSGEAKAKAAKEEQAKSRFETLEKEIAAYQEALAEKEPLVDDSRGAAEGEFPPGLLENLELTEQQKKYLAAHYVKQGKVLEQQNRLQEALEAYRKATMYDPDNLEARRRRNELEALINQDRGGRIDVNMDRLVALSKVREEQARREVERDFENGLRLYEEGKFKEARKQFTSVIENVAYSGITFDKADFKGRAENLRRECEAKILIQENQRIKKIREAVRDVTDKRSAEMAERERGLIDTWIQNAQYELEKKRFDAAIRNCNLVLKKDPLNHSANLIKNRAVLAKHAATIEELQEMHSEEWREIVLECERSLIPYYDETEVIFDPKVWEIASRRVGLAAGEEEGESEEVRRIRNILATIEIPTLSFTDEDLTSVIEFIKNITGVNMIINPEVEEEEPTVTINLANVKVEQALRILCRLKELTYVFMEGDILYITKAGQTGEEAVLRMHDIRDLTKSVTDFPGPDITLESGDDEMNMPTFTSAEDEAVVVTGEAIVELIQSSIDPVSWEESEECTISMFGKQLLVNHTPTVHREIAELLNQLRQHTGLLVSIESRFVLVQDMLLREISSDFRGLGGMGPTRAMPHDPDSVFPPTASTLYYDPDTGEMIQTMDSMFGPLTANYDNTYIPHRNDPRAGYKNWDPRARILPFNPFEMTDLRWTDLQAHRHSPGGVFATGPIMRDNTGVPGADIAPAAGIFFTDDYERAEFMARTENIFDISLSSVEIPGHLHNWGGLALQMAYLDDAQVNYVLQAVYKSYRGHLVTAPKITCFNTQQAHIAVQRQFAYIRDYDVQVAQAVAAADPLIDYIQDGLVLDVRPTVSNDRKWITLEIKPTIVELEQPIPRQWVVLSFNVIVPIELPAMTIRSVETTARIPDGGTLLLGGLKEVRERELESNVPWFGNMPVISFFFKKKGVASERFYLLILCRAKSIVLEDIERTL